jgi:hypothetical protein
VVYYFSPYWNYLQNMAAQCDTQYPVGTQVDICWLDFTSLRKTPCLIQSSLSRPKGRFLCFVLFSLFLAINW